VNRQPIRLDRVHRYYLFVLAFLFVLAPVLCPAQAPPAYTISTIAGNCSTFPCTGNYAGDGGPATNAFLSGPSDVRFDSSGKLYIADTVNNRIRVVDLSTGVISSFVGNGTSGYGGDGSAITSDTVEVYSPTGIAFDSQGDLFIADTGNDVIREVTTSDIISTVAGSNTLGAGYTGDLGPATGAQLWFPSGVAVDVAGNVYIADPNNNEVRVLCANHTPIACKNLAAGDINTVAGSYVSGAAYTGDGGPASAALLSDPVALAFDAAGNLYISDSGNNVIRKVDTSGIITTVVGDGTGNAGFLGDGGPATKALLSGPKGMALDSSGYLYIADNLNCRIRVVEPNGIITTIAGNGLFGRSGDGGSALSAELDRPSAMAVSGGMVYIADNGNNLIRMLTPQVQAPTIGAGGVVNDASYTAPVAPGSIAAVFGSFSLPSSSTETNLPLATSVQNLSLQFSGGFDAPIYYASSGQVNIQVPWELSAPSTATLAATWYGAAGTAQNVTVALYAPAIFTMNAQGTGSGAILDSTYHLVDSSNPAIPGTTYILIYCTGLGAVSANQPATGAAASLTDLAPTTHLPSVTIGGVTANVSFSGLAPGYVGLYQVNALVPAGVASGSAIDLSITMEGVTSNTVTIPVQ
jgi:uncharacterized protein (TIGR03437 family)